MGSKGTSTQTQSGTSSYTPSPQIAQAGQQAITQAQQAATSPFQLPTAPVAGFTPDQLRAFQQTQQQQGLAQPYYNQAQGLFNQSAAPISAGQISQYMNPYASQVLANLQETQGQQMQDLTGRATQAAGGVGASRIGVAQGELARQQNLATGQTLSGIYGNALSAAQQDAQRQQASAYGIGNLGGAAQNAAMQGTQALYNQGSIQQQLKQAQLNAPYQNTLARIAFPYQQAQYLAGITGSLAGPMGGTTTSNQFGTTTPAQPSIWSQLLGAGTAGVGAYGALNEAGVFNNNNPAYGGNGVYGGSSANPLQGLSPSDYGPGYASGGEVSGEPSWMTSDPTIPTIAMHASPINQPKIQPLNMSSGKDSGGIGGDIANIAKTVATVAPLFLAQGGAVGTTPYQGYADGGDTFDDRFDISGMGEMPRSEALAHYLRQPATYFKSAYAGPDPQLLPQEQARSVAAPTTRFTVNPQEVINPGEPHRLPSVRADGSPIVPPDQMRADETSEAAGPKATGLRALSPAAADVAEQNFASTRGLRANVPYGDLSPTTDVSRGFAKSPWLALINAGAGMMAGTSPYAGVNIGKGLQAGTETLGKQREASREEESVNQRAQQLALEAEKHRDSLTKMSPYQAGQLEQAQSALEQNKWQIVYDPQTQTPYWTKPGEKPVPALPGQAPPTSAGTPISGVTPPAGTAPKVASADGAAPAPSGGPKPLDFAYSPPSNDPTTGPGPVFNPKTGGLSPEHVQITRAVTDRADKAGEAAADASVQLGHLKQALSKIDELKKEAGGMLQTGAFAKQRFELAKTINGITAPFGIEPINPALIGSAEEAGKITTRLGFALSRTLGAREAMQIVQQSIAANPGIENTPEGRRFIISTIEAGIQRNQDMQQFVSDYRRHWRSAAGAEAQFNKQNPPEKYIARVGIETAPPEFRSPAAVEKAINRLRSDPSPATVALFNKIYHGTADYFLKGNVAP